MRPTGTAKFVSATLALAFWLFLLRDASAGVLASGGAVVALFLALGLWRPRLTLGLLVAFAASSHIFSAIWGVPWFSPAEGGLLALWVAVSWRDRSAPKRPLDLAGFFSLLFALYALLSALALIFRFRYPSLMTGLSFLIHPWGDLLRLPMSTPLFGFRSATLLLEGMLAFSLARRVDSEPGEGRAALWGLWCGGCVAVLSYFVYYLPRLFDPAKNWLVYRPALTLHDANSAASFGLLVLGAGLALASRGVRGKWVYLLPGLAILFLGGSRIAFVIALLGCAGIAAFLGWVRRRSSSRGAEAAPMPSLGPALLATVLLAGIVGFMVVKMERFQDLFSGDAYTTHHLSGRQGFLQAGLKMVSEYPVSGVGGGTYTSTVHQFLEKGSAPVHSQIENAHSYPLQLAAEYGTPALLLWFGFLWVVLGPRLRHWRVLSPEAAGLLSGVLFYLLHCLQSHPLLLAEHQILFWAALGGLAGHFNRLAESVRPSRLRWVASLCLLAPLWSLTQPCPAASQAHSFGVYASPVDPGGEQMAWTAAQAWVVLPAGAVSQFDCGVSRPNLATAPVTLRLEAGGATAYEEVFSKPSQLRAAFQLAPAGGGALLHLSVSPPFVPRVLGLSRDARVLGVQLRKWPIEAEGVPPPGGSWRPLAEGLQGAIALAEAETLPAEGRKFSCALVDEAPRMVPGETLSIPVYIRNTSDILWRGNQYANSPKPLCASYHWKRPDGTLVLWDGVRTPITTDVAPGLNWEGDLWVNAPQEPGEYLLEIDMLQETVAWFGGGPSVRVVIAP